jgi:sugar phosphate isomerase/epimerase
MWTLSGFADEISPDLDEQCRVLAELGIGYIEFRSAWEINVLDLDDEQLKQVAETLSRYGIRTSSVGSPIGKIGIRDDFDAHLARFDRALHVAEFLEAPFIRIFSFFIPANDTPDAYRDEVLRRMSALVERAQGRPVTLLHENEKEIYGDIPSRCLDILAGVGSPALRAAWDAANFVQCGVSPYKEGYVSLRPFIEYVHVKDALSGSDTVVPAGEGDGQWPETLSALRASGFDGFFSLEPHLASAGTYSGFSGPELFRKATGAFKELLRSQGIEWA